MTREDKCPSSVSHIFKSSAQCQTNTGVMEIHVVCAKTWLQYFTMTNYEIICLLYCKRINCINRVLNHLNMQIMHTDVHVESEEQHLYIRVWPIVWLYLHGSEFDKHAISFLLNIYINSQLKTEKTKSSMRSVLKVAKITLNYYK